MMDNLPALCYAGSMNHTVEKREGFKGERMIVLPTEALSLIHILKPVTWMQVPSVMASYSSWVQAMS